MTSLIIPAPAPEEVEADVALGDFWPPIAPAELRAAQNIDATVPAERLRAVIIEALATAGEELAAWQADQITAGFATLADVPGERVGEKTLHEMRFAWAVGCLVKAMVMERYRNFDATAAGDKKADAMAPAIDDARRDYRWAISAIQGKPRNTVELI